MGRRRYPLFVIDREQHHRAGETDYIVCTDLDNGFVASTEYVPAQEEECGDDYRIGLDNNGLSLKIQILKLTGRHPETAAVRTLLKAAMKEYAARCQPPASDGITVADCVRAVDTMIRSNWQCMKMESGNREAQEMGLYAIAVFSKIKDILERSR